MMYLFHAHDWKITEFTSFPYFNKFGPPLNKTMLSKDFLTMFAFLLIHGFCRWNFPVQINLDFFISGLICAHYLAYKIFKWKLNNISDTRLRKKKQVTFQKTKLALGAMTQHDTNYAWKLKTELRVVFAMLNMCSLPKVSLNGEICNKILHVLKISNTLSRSFLVIKSSKQRFKHSESRKRVSKTRDIHMLCTS